MSLVILGMGTARPPAVIDQEAALGIARQLCCRTEEQASWLPAMYRGTGIVTRSLALGEDVIRDVIQGTRESGSVFLPRPAGHGDGEDAGPTTGQRLRHYADLAPPLAVEAARAAVERSRVQPGDFTHLVTVSCTGFIAPGVDLALIAGLGLPLTVERTHVGYMGCHGALNGLRVAGAFAAVSPRTRILLCAVELCSLHYHYGWNPQKLIANALFGDGAAALVAGGREEAPVGCGSGTGVPPVGHRSAWALSATGSCLIPGSAQDMTWSVGDHGFEMTLSRKVPGLIATHLRPWLEGWLAGQGLTLAEVRSWAVHPGGPRILSAVEESLGLPPAATSASRAVLAECGNMSSPTVLFILDRIRAQDSPPGSQRPCVALAFGPGVMAEAALFR
jgi:predicted naringenin-chalcone synthase